MSLEYWHPADLFSLVNLETGSQTCVGWAPSKRRRCQNPIAAHNRSGAMVILKELAASFEAVDWRLMKSDLEDAASMCLCRANHQRQAEEVMAKWCQLLREEARLEAPTFRMPTSTSEALPAHRRTRPQPLRYRTPSPPPAPTRRLITAHVDSPPTLRLHPRSPPPEHTTRLLPRLSRIRNTSASPIFTPSASSISTPSSSPIYTPSVSSISTPSVSSISTPSVSSISTSSVSSISTPSASPIYTPSASSISTPSASPSPVVLRRVIQSPPPSEVEVQQRPSISQEVSQSLPTPRCSPCTRNHVPRRSSDEDCPICMEPLANVPVEEMLWCKRTCGRSVHTACMQEWLQIGRTDCVFCRGRWRRPCEHDTASPVFSIWTEDEIGLVGLFDLMAHMKERMNAWLY